MIPLRDNIPTRTFPLVTLLLIVGNLAVFIYQLALAEQMELLLYQAGLIPARFSLFSLFTYMFLHGGWLHLIGNLWILWIFGGNVESRLGYRRYLAFYLLCGLFAGLFHMATNPLSAIPTVGASGAIAGIMGGYFLLYPRARVLTLVPIFIFFQLIELPAFIFLGVWFLLQLFMGTMSSQQSGIAWWAHIGGFLVGLYLVRLLAKKPRRRRPSNRHSSSTE